MYIKYISKIMYFFKSLIENIRICTYLKKRIALFNKKNKSAYVFFILVKPCSYLLLIGEQDYINFYHWSG